MHRHPRLAPAALALAGLLTLPCAALAAAPQDSRVVEGTVRLPDAGGRTLGGARIARTALTPAELSAPFPFSVTLRMRDFAGLQARVASGGRVSDAEMEARYLPLRGDYERVAAWLAAQGFEQTLPDRCHTTVFVRGSVAQVARALGIRVARVSVADGDYTSAISEPSLPADLAGVVLSVNSLQPQFRMRHIGVRSRPLPDDAVNGYVFVTPDNVASAYNIPASATGAGQTIAVVGEAPAANADLASFWTSIGSSQSTANVTTINVDGGPSGSPTSGLESEADLDVEWAGAMAPGAAIRLYLSQSIDSCFTQIQNDLPSHPTLSVVSVSFGSIESSDSPSALSALSQTMASFAAAGVSVLAASGDAGSNPNGGTGPGMYSAAQPLAVAYPASDPSVTGVGGTTAGYTGSWSFTGEVVWNQIAAAQSASSGGVSGTFAKPSWQTGGSLLASQSMRCVPDVAAVADSNLTNVNLGPKFMPFTGTDVGALIYSSGAPAAVSGTSLACPIWAAITADINQARAAAGQGPIGLLNPVLYSLAGTSAFNDVTSGSNGAYTAGPGYDLCTGLGSPNVGNLIAAIVTQPPLQRLVNISVRSQVETGANITIAGFVIKGAAGTTKSILVRGAGPALTAFGVAGALPGTVLSVYDSEATPQVIASDTGWGNAPVAGTSTVAASYRQATAADMAAVGAFGFASGSGDSAMVLTLPPGAYTVESTGLGGTSGVGLTEVYEMDTTDAEVFANISSRCFVGTGAAVAISGFVVGGTEPATLLIRGVGPALAGFGLTGILAAPVLSLQNQKDASVVATSTGWSNAPVTGTLPAGASVRQATADDMSAAGAFALAAGSADCAMVVTLPPGAYTAEVSGAAGTTGTALAEVYKF
jgi:kumamolisin